MPRKRPATRFDDLIAAATDAFALGGGFRRTQMDDVARALGVAKGTLYLYVASKEALFDLVVRFADHPADTPDLPWPTPAPGATRAVLAERLADHGGFVVLDAALADAPGARVAEVVEEVYDVLRANRRTIRVVNASARDLPELAALWFHEARAPLLQRLEQYVRRGLAAGAFLPQADPAAAARMVVETCMWFAVHRTWDFDPHPQDDEAVRRTVVDGLVRALAGSP